MLIVGIDPGLDGAIVWVEDGGARRVEDIPTREVTEGRREMDRREMWRLLADGPDIDAFVIEKVQADPRFGSQQSFKFGETYGGLLSLIEVYDAPCHRVRPQEWKALILRGTDKSKEAAIAWAAYRFPSLNLKRPRARKPSHDRAEAACLAEFGRIAKVFE